MAKTQNDGLEASENPRPRHEGAIVSENTGETVNSQAEPTTVVVTLHESMEATITAAIAELRATAADVEIAKLKADYQNATIAGVSDKDGYKFVSEGIRKMKAIRSAIEAKRKKLKAPALKYGREVDAEAERLKSQLEALEKSLAAKKLEIDQAAEIRFNKRTTDLFSLGYSFDGIVYFFSGQDVNLGTKTITPTDIRDVEIFEPVLAECAKFVESVKTERKRLADIAEAEANAERERIESERKAAEDKAAAEAAEKERLRLENEAKDRELEELRRQLAEKNKPAETVTPEPEPQIKIDPAKLSQIPAAGVVNATAGPAQNSTPNPVQNPAPNPVHKSTPAWQKPQKSEDFINGFNACKSEIVKVFSNLDSKLTRAEWISVFQNLQP